jgi:hypothetical protein
VIRRWCAGDASTSGVAGHWFGLAENKGDGDGCAGLGSVAMVFPCGTLFSASSGVFDCDVARRSQGQEPTAGLVRADCYVNRKPTSVKRTQ